MNFKDCNIYYTFDMKEDFSKQNFQSIIITDIEKQPKDLYKILKLDDSKIKVEHLYEGHLPTRMLAGRNEEDFLLQKDFAIYYVRFVSSLTEESFQKIIVSDVNAEIHEEVMGMYDNIQMIEKAACIIPYGEPLY